MNLFDMHCDTLYECFETRKQLRQNDLAIDKSGAERFGEYAQVFALFCGARAPSDALQQGRRCVLDIPQNARFAEFVQFARAQLAQNADWLTLCLNAQDMMRAREGGKRMAFLSIEGAELLPDVPNALRIAHQAGVRLLTLVWNHENPFGGSASRDQSEGLTARGRALVQECEALGIIVDVSHLSDRGFYDVCEVATKPFVASHSNARAVCNHCRNVTEDMFAEIVRRQGMLGINLYAPFLVKDGNCQIEDVLRHIEYFMAHGGAKCLSLGCDLDGCDALPAGIERQGDLYKLADCMLQKGYKEDTVNDIFFENLFAFFCRML